MKKISILVLLILVSNYYINGQTTIYSQDFGSGVPAGWIITDSAGVGKVWTYDTNGPSGPAANPADTLKSTTYSNGIMIMDDDFYGQSPGFNATALISTAINCSAYNKVRIKFQDFFRYFAPANSQGVLYVSTDSINWIDIYHAEAGLANNAPTPNPHLPDINITAIAGNQPALYLKFVYRGDWGYYWELDDIEVYEPLPAAIDDNNNALNPITFYPNPSRSIFNVSGLTEDAIIIVTNQMGQIVLTTKFNASNKELDLIGVPAGLYHVNVRSEKFNINQAISNIK